MPIPNEWCDIDDQPSYMYLEVPEFELNDEQEDIYREHLEFWDIWNNFKGSIDINKQFKVYNYYRKNLPSHYKYLCDRIIQCNVLFYHEDQIKWKQNQDKTIKSIIGLLLKNKNISKNQLMEVLNTSDFI